MSKIKYDVIVKLTSGDEIVLKDATRYFFEYDKGCAVVEKNGYNFFFNLTQIVYIGRDYDLKN